MIGNTMHLSSTFVLPFSFAIYAFVPISTSRPFLSLWCRTSSAWSASTETSAYISSCLSKPQSPSRSKSGEQSSPLCTSTIPSLLLNRPIVGSGSSQSVVESWSWLFHPSHMLFTHDIRDSGRCLVAGLIVTDSTFFVWLSMSFEVSPATSAGVIEEGGHANKKKATHKQMMISLRSNGAFSLKGDHQYPRGHHKQGPTCASVNLSRLNIHGGLQHVRSVRSLVQR